MTPERVSTVAVTPAGERQHRSRLFDALEAAYPVRFEGRDLGAFRGADAVYAVGPAAAAAAAVGELPSLSAIGNESAAARPPAALALSDHRMLARPLNAARLSETRAGELPRLETNGEALATIAGRPAWVLRGSDRTLQHVVSTAPAELVDGEALRNRLTNGRCLALLALSHFVHDVISDFGFRKPPLRAAFVLDDPNLRWPTYGHIRYDDLLKSAVAHRYHAVMAMVPLDGWPVHPRAAGVFRQGRGHLSLCTHGNDHDGPELGRPRSTAEALPLAAQALARTTAFERRTGVSVDRVMVPPHERLSEAAASALLACGFEGLCHTRPYPWIERSPDLPWLTRPAGAAPLVGWGSAEVMVGGLPFLLRRAFDFDRADLILRAYLGQPLIISGHHDLLRHGTGALEEAAAQVNRLGDVRWCSLGDIARSSVETRQRGDVLDIRLLGRHVAVDIPAGIREARVDAQAFPAGAATSLQVRRPAGSWAEVSDGSDVRLEVDGFGGLELRLSQPLKADILPHRRVRLRLRPLARRLASESRDRARPMVVRRPR